MSSPLRGKEREAQFAGFLKSRGLIFEHPSHRIYLLNGEPHTSSGVGYIPDFYVPSLDTYYEVVGSRQAFDCNKEKIRKFQKHFNLVVCRPDGTIWNIWNSRVPKTKVTCFNCEKPFEHYIRKKGLCWECNPRKVKK